MIEYDSNTAKNPMSDKTNKSANLAIVVGCFGILIILISMIGYNHLIKTHNECVINLMQFNTTAAEAKDACK